MKSPEESFSDNSHSSHINMTETIEEAKEREKLMTEVAEIARQHLIDIGADQSLSNLKIF